MAAASGRTSLLLVLGVLGTDHAVRPLEHHVTVFVGNSEKLGYEDQGKLGRDLGHEVGPALGAHPIQDLVGGQVDALLQLLDRPRGEALVHQPPVAGVQRRVHVQHHKRCCSRASSGISKGRVPRRADENRS